MNCTVAITNFHRAPMLDRAIQSAFAAGFTKVTVSAMDPDPDVEAVLAKHPVKVVRNPDRGVNESWLMAAYHADTPYVIILHDDDQLLPGLGKVYREIIEPKLKAGVGFASWRGHVRTEDGVIRPCEYFRGPTKVYPSHQLERFLLQRNRLSLSPIVSVFNRQVLIHALKEAEEALVGKDCYLHPSMLLGTELIAYLRHCSAFKTWLFVDGVYSHYGAWEGSGTVQAEQGGTMKVLIKGYDHSRDYYQKHKSKAFPHPGRLLLLSSPHPNSGKRAADARRSWDFHFQLGSMLDFPVLSSYLPRSSASVGCEKGLPFLRDLLDYGAAHAMEEDVCVYANLDLAVTVNFPSLIAETLERSGGVAAVWRRTLSYDPSRLYLSAKNGVLDGGVDAIAVTPAWWRKNREKIPDMILCSNHWDWVWRTYTERQTAGRAYQSDGTMHAPHPSLFSQLKHSTPAQRWNQELARKFFTEIGDIASARSLSVGEAGPAAKRW